MNFGVLSLLYLLQKFLIVTIKDKNGTLSIRDIVSGISSNTFSLLQELLAILSRVQQFIIIYPLTQYTSIWNIFTLEKKSFFQWVWFSHSIFVADVHLIPPSCHGHNNYMCNSVKNKNLESEQQLCSILFSLPAPFSADFESLA